MAKVGRPAGTGRKQTGAKEFVYIWQTSESADEVVDKLQKIDGGRPRTRGAVMAKAAKLRKLHVPLKKHTNSINYEELADYARSLEKP